MSVSWQVPGNLQCFQYQIWVPSWGNVSWVQLDSSWFQGHVTAPCCISSDFLAMLAIVVVLRCCSWRGLFDCITLLLLDRTVWLHHSLGCSHVFSGGMEGRLQEGDFQVRAGLSHVVSLQCGNPQIAGSPAWAPASLLQLVHLWLREHPGRGSGKSGNNQNVKKQWHSLS